MEGKEETAETRIGIRGVGLDLIECEENIVRGNTIFGTKTDNFALGVELIDCYLNILNNNIIEFCEEEGIYFSDSTYNNFEGNLVFNNSTGNVNQHAGIWLGGGATHNSIVGNKSIDDRGTPAQKYGVGEAGAGADWNLVTNNVCVDNVTAEIFIVGGNTINANNITGP